MNYEQFVTEKVGPMSTYSTTEQIEKYLKSLSSEELSKWKSDMKVYGESSACQAKPNENSDQRTERVMIKRSRALVDPLLCKLAK